MDKDNLGGTALHDAAEQGQVGLQLVHLKYVFLLLFDLALCQLHQVGSISVLLRYGVDTYSEDLDGLKPIDLAKDNKHDECVKILFKALAPTILVII